MVVDQIGVGLSVICNGYLIARLLWDGCWRQLWCACGVLLTVITVVRLFYAAPDWLFGTLAVVIVLVGELYRHLPIARERQAL